MDNLTLIMPKKEPASPLYQFQVVQVDPSSPLIRRVSSNNNIYNPADKNKSLRSAPRKLGEINDEDVEKFEEWLTKEEPKLERNDSYKKEDHKSRNNRALGINEKEKFKENDPYIYRRILLSTIPNHLKPIYEQEETLKACSCLMDLLEIRDKYISYDTQNLQHPFLHSTRGE